jgi:hypothetical protein
MELTQGSETSANYNYNMTPGKYRKEHIQYILLLYLITGSKHNGDALSKIVKLRWKGTKQKIGHRRK